MQPAVDWFGVIDTLVCNGGIISAHKLATTATPTGSACSKCPSSNALAVRTVSKHGLAGLLVMRSLCHKAGQRTFFDG